MTSPEGQVFLLHKSAGFEAAMTLPGEGGERRVIGYSFRIDVVVEGRVADGAEWIGDLDALGASLDAVAQELDHGMLDGVEGLGAPTLEQISLWVAGQLKRDWPGLKTVTLSRPSRSESVTLVL